MGVRNSIATAVILGLVLVFMVSVVGMAFWTASPGGWMMGLGMMSCSGSGFGWMSTLLGPLPFLLFIALIMLGAYYLVAGRGATETGMDRSLKILRERFVKGEIGEEQFLKMREALRK